MYDISDILAASNMDTIHGTCDWLRRAQPNNHTLSGNLTFVLATGCVVFEAYGPTGIVLFTPRGPSMRKSMISIGVTASLT